MISRTWLVNWALAKGKALGLGVDIVCLMCVVFRASLVGSWAFLDYYRYKKVKVDNEVESI